MEPAHLPLFCPRTNTKYGVGYQCTPTRDQLCEINVSDSYSLHEQSIKVTGSRKGASQEFRPRTIKFITKQRRRESNRLVEETDENVSTPSAVLIYSCRP